MVLDPFMLLLLGFLLNLEIVDMCGPYMFPFMRDMRIKSADVAMVFYEIGKESSMQEAANVLEKIKQLRPPEASTGEEGDLGVVLVGTKFDLFTGKDLDEMYATCKQYFGTFPDLEKRIQLTSAKNNSNVSRAFDVAMEYIIRGAPPGGLTRAKVERSKSCAQQ